jgi:hypothetical protein
MVEAEALVESNHLKSRIVTDRIANQAIDLFCPAVR